MRTRRGFVAGIAPCLTLAVAGLVGCGQVEDSADMRSASGHADQTNGSDLSAGARVSFVDVGKGDCILVQAGGHAVLIDTGYDDTSGEVVSYLQAQGIVSLDGVIITHYDKDHVGGLRAMGESFDIAATYLPGYVGGDNQYRSVVNAVRDLALPAHKVVEEQSLGLGGAELTIYPSSLTYVPDAEGDEGNDNDLSLVAELVAGEDSYLFAGDLEKEGIEAYLKAGHGHHDVLKMPHHGQKTGNTDDLLADVSPKIAVITDGRDDPADKKTLKLLEKAGVDVYRTSEQGTIVVESDGAGNYTVTD